MKRRTFLTAVAATSFGCAHTGPRLNVFNWSSYVAPDTISNFEQETGIRVRYGTYESAPEMLAKVMGGNSGWDVVFPSLEYVHPMRDLGLLSQLIPAQLQNLHQLQP